MKERQTRVSRAKITSIFRSIKQYRLEGETPLLVRKEAVLLWVLDELSLDGSKHVATCPLGGKKMFGVFMLLAMLP